MTKTQRSWLSQGATYGNVAGTACKNWLEDVTGLELVAIRSSEPYTRPHHTEVEAFKAKCKARLVEATQP